MIRSRTVHLPCHGFEGGGEAEFEPPLFMLLRNSRDFRRVWLQRRSCTLGTSFPETPTSGGHAPQQEWDGTFALEGFAG